jgi:hypothetical protein
MVASIATQELKEDLVSVDASIGDLIGAREAESMAGKMWQNLLNYMAQLYLSSS